VLYGGNGNDLVLGGEGADQLYGDAGDDLLDGGAGNDALNGGAGNDTYVFGLGDGRDTIDNLSVSAASDRDILSLEGITKDSLWLSRQVSNLVIDVIGSEDSITVQGWYSNSNRQLDAIQTGSVSLYVNQVDNLVNAMAAFGAPASGEIDLTQAQKDQLNVVIAANWQ
ncbi:calcium-binding protein, partial [Pseudomonas sp. Irchel s3f19]